MKNIKTFLPGILLLLPLLGFSQSKVIDVSVNADGVEITTLQEVIGSTTNTTVNEKFTGGGSANHFPDNIALPVNPSYKGSIAGIGLSDLDPKLKAVIVGYQKQLDNGFKLDTSKPIVFVGTATGARATCGHKSNYDYKLVQMSFGISMSESECKAEFAQHDSKWEHEKVNNKVLAGNRAKILEQIFKKQILDDPKYAELTKGYKIGAPKIVTGASERSSESVKMTLVKSTSSQTCNFKLKPKSGGKGVQTFVQDIGNYKGTLLIEFQPLAIPDRLIVSYGGVEKENTNYIGGMEKLGSAVQKGGRYYTGFIDQCGKDLTKMIGIGNSEMRIASWKRCGEKLGLSKPVTFDRKVSAKKFMKFPIELDGKSSKVTISVEGPFGSTVWNIRAACQ